MDELEGRQKVEILFAILMIASAFMPVMKVPLMGGVSMFDLGWGGYGIVCLGIVALVGASIDSRWIPVICGGLAILITASFLIYFGWEITHIGKQIDRELRGNPFKGLAKALANAVSLSWGWVVILCSGVGCGIAPILAELFLGSGARREEPETRVRKEPYFGPSPYVLRPESRDTRGPLVIKEPQRRSLGAR